MSALKRLMPTTATFVSLILLMTLCVSNSAYAIIAPTTKAVEGESNPFPTDTPAPKTAPKTPPAQTSHGIDDTSSVADSTALAAQPSANLMATINPAVSAQRPPLPIFWLALTGVLSLAGLTVAARLVFSTEREAAVA